MRRDFFVSVVLLIGFAISVGEASAATFTKLDNPLGDNGTVAMGMDGNNIVGYYKDSSNISHGFVYDGSTWTTLDAPLGVSTTATGIDGGNIVGWYKDSSNSNHGFLYNGSTWTTIDDPAGANGTSPYDISGNNIVGLYRSASGSQYGFLNNGSTWTTMQMPSGYYPQPQGISGTDVVGLYSDSSNYCHGFLYDGSTYTTIDNPLAGGNLLCLNGISGDTIVGDYYAADGTFHGCIYDGSVFTDLNCPFGTSTFLTAISGNTVIGYYGDSVSGPYRSFVATVPEPSSLILLTIGGIGLAVYGWRRAAFPKILAKNRLLAALALLAMTMVSSAAFAEQITITQTGSGSGTLNGVAFLATDFTITSIGDTTNRQTLNWGFAINNESASISIDGVGTYDFVTPTRTTWSKYSGGAVGFGRASGTDLYDGSFGSIGLADWDMLSSLGPITGTASLMQWGLQSVETTGGVLYFDNASTPTTYQATVGAVPEPSSLILIGIATICGSFYSWRKRHACCR